VFRAFAGLALLAIAGFCIYGFVASFEPPGFAGFKIIYATIGLLCLAGAVRLLLKRRSDSD
jgi:hypothetical protein